MRELEVHNVTDYKADDIAVLIKSRGFKEELITKEHPGFKATEEYFEKMKNSMDKDEYAKLLKEMEELMGEKEEDLDKHDPELDGENTATFFDPEEQKKYEEYLEKKRAKREKKRAERKAKQEAEAQEGGEAGEAKSGEAKKDL
jgi:hypothetical protein